MPHADGALAAWNGSPAAADGSPTIWVDVEDLYEYASKNGRPSGIQRLAYELCLALAASGSAVRFLRHDGARNSFRAIAWSEIEALYAHLSRGGPPPPPDREPGGRSGVRRAVRAAVSGIPGEIRMPLRRFTIAQIHAARAMAGVARGAVASARRALSGAGAVPEESRAAFTGQVRPGDTVLALGAMWFHPDYAALIEATRKAHGIRFGLLVYDMIPLRRPEWCEPGLIRLFREFIHAALPQADVIFTISRASAADILRYSAEAGLALRSEPVAIPIGAGFAPPPPGDLPDGHRAVPVPAPYALIVATVEARKNHALLFRVWRRLLEERPAAEVPTLVMAGRRGWLVQDLFVQMKSSGLLGDKIVFFENPTDDELVALYQGCAFTLFPSFYEGWGLPVTESLAFGQPCLAASTTSVPEAGGDLARYFDPYDEAAAFEAVCALIDDPAALDRWRAHIRSTFRPASWSTTAAAVVRAVHTVGR